MAAMGGASDTHKFRKCFANCDTNIESGVGGRLMRDSKYVAFVPFTFVCIVFDFSCEISSVNSLKIKRCKTMAYMRAMHMQHACMHTQCTHLT